MQRTASQLPLFPDRQATTETQKPGDLPGFSVRESARAKRLSIKVFPRGRVEVVVPRRTRPADVEAFVSENRGWIARAIDSFARDITPDTYQLPTRIRLAAVDREAIVAYRTSDRTRTVRHREHGDTLVLTGPVNDEAACSLALRRWLSKVAREEFAPSLETLSRDLGLPFRKLQIRAQRTCWGSHSSSGTISLNLCLLFLEPRVVRYLMIHELCHAVHMNHSRRFWALVEKHEPDYRRLDKQLSDAWRHIPAWVGLY